MRIRWLSLAGDDLEQVGSWYREHAPEHLGQVAQSILTATDSLASLPLRGRPGVVDGTRELLVPGAPYILVYAVRDDSVVIIRVVHQHRLWPSG